MPFPEKKKALVYILYNKHLDFWFNIDGRVRSHFLSLSRVNQVLIIFSISDKGQQF